MVTKKSRKDSRVHNAKSRFLLSITCFLFISLAMCFVHCPVASAEEKTIGVIIPGGIYYYNNINKAFLAELGRKGYRKRVKIIKQRPHPDPYSLVNAARKLIALDVDVIVAYGFPAVSAVQEERTKIPVIYAGVYDPLVSKIKRQNITGTISKVSVSSLLRYLKELRPISSLGVVYSSYEEDSVFQAKELHRLSQQYGFKIEAINIKGEGNIDELLAAKKIDAIFVTSSSKASMECNKILGYSENNRLPTASILPFMNVYPIVALYVKPEDIGTMTADKVIKILNEVSPEMIPSDSSNDTELVCNLKGLIDMGFKMPMNLITEATKLIE